VSNRHVRVIDIPLHLVSELKFSNTTGLRIKEHGQKLCHISKFDQHLEMKIQHNSNSSIHIHWTSSILRWVVRRICVLSPYS